MPKVCVVGGGTAGREAAEEALMRGAQVTLLEGSEVPDVAWSRWPELLSHSEVPGWKSARSRRRGNPEILHAEAVSARPGSVELAGGRMLQFDRVVVTTGSRFRLPRFIGHRKPGVIVLNMSSKCVELGLARSSLSKLVVYGEGMRALQIADRLTGGGRAVLVLVSHWKLGEPDRRIMEVIHQAAAEQGAEVMTGTLERAVGAERVEAVLVDGRVIPCDSLVVIPERVPRPLPVDGQAGPRGGLLVDSELRTSVGSLLAAGGCAEMAVAPGRVVGLAEHPGPSGRVAGANGGGGHVAFRPVPRALCVAFGLALLREEAPPSYPDPPAGYQDVAGIRWGPKSACAISFDRGSGRVSKVDSVEEASLPFTSAFPLAAGTTTLQALAYGGSIDISLISDTARLGLREWSDS